MLRENRLIALVHPDMQAVKSENISPEKLREIMNENKGILNKSVAQYERISEIQIREEEIEKTPKKSVKRFLYS